MDVHTANEEDYLVELRSVANDTKKTVYAIYDDGALLYNRHIE